MQGSHIGAFGLWAFLAENWSSAQFAQFPLASGWAANNDWLGEAVSPIHHTSRARILGLLAWREGAGLEWGGGGVS